MFTNREYPCLWYGCRERFVTMMDRLRHFRREHSVMR